MRSEKALLSGARCLEEKSLIEIYSRFSPGIYRYAARLLCDQDMAEDCVSETFSRFIESLNNGGGPGEHLQAYLYQIAHNWITDHFRNESLKVTGMQVDLGSDGNEPARIAFANIEFDSVRSALSLLKPNQRQVIILKYLEGWSNDEIASSLGKTTGAVRVLHHRAVMSLKKILRQPELTV